ncbi:MAG: CRTAC1 family protein [Acidobacteria bacterium]|nr:CRTAC1 family protein [Acidobacteriota bacterium]
MTKILCTIRLHWATVSFLSVLFILGRCALLAQLPAETPNQNASQLGMSSVATGAAHTAVLDDQHRPITAGGFVKYGPIVFQDVAQQAGLTIWTQKMGSPAKRVILETIGSGVALLDYDNDGWLDIYLVNGSTVDALTGKASPPHAALFHNNRDGTFTDVAEKAGVTNDRWGFGAVVGDYDNDGWPDIYVSNYGGNRLYHNNHDGTFTDAAEKAGVTVGGWSTGATWGDYDGDGRLDLFVPGYVHIALADLIQQENQTSTPCTFRGIQVMCGPRGLKGEPDHLFHNNGDGTFTDVSIKAGVADKSTYYGLASLFADINNDGKLDLLVADDSTPSYLYVNKGNGSFEDDSFASGYALNENGSETASMGIGIGDYTHNGRLDIYNTTFSDDYNPLYRNDGNANFTDIAHQAGIAEPTVPFLGWGNAFFDYDNDGWLDLFVVNGHVYPQVDTQNFGTTWAQRPLLFHNIRGIFHLVPAVEGSGLAKVDTGRGMAYGDLFNDGKIDVVINNLDATPSLFRNVTGTPPEIAEERTGTPVPTPNHWIAFKLIGGTRSPRDAIGATMYLTAGGFRQRADVLAGGSYASSHDQRPHFGLGTATKIDGIEIRWPDGTKQQVKPPAAVDRFYIITEGEAAQPLNLEPAQARPLDTSK